MATLATNNPTLIDWAKRLDPDGKIAPIVELLMQRNEMLIDMVWMEANSATGHRTTVRTGLPSVTWRLLNSGVTPSKSTTAQITEAIGKLEAWSEVDVALAKLNGDVNAFRASEGSSFFEAMNQEMASTMIYGNSSTAPEEFTGLAPRYNDTTASNGQNIIDAGGTGSDNSSIWLIGWGKNTCSGIFPKGSKAGLEHTDHGEKMVTVTAGVGGSKMLAYVEQWVWDAGLALRDWRYVVRIANIDISNLTSETSAADLTKLMIKAMHRVPSLKLAKFAFYMNRTVLQMLDIQRLTNTVAGGGITTETIDGITTMYFRGIPLRLMDTLTEAESAVS